MKTAIRPSAISQRKRDFFFIFLLSYPFFLFAALAERLFSTRSRTAAERRSIFAEASAAAYRTLPYAF